MNLTKACTAKDDKSCLVTCQDPTASNQCVVLQTQLVDGSACGYGGSCASGTCKAGSWQDTFKAWYRQNLQISIPVTVVIAVLFFTIVWFIILSIRRCCIRRSRPPLKVIGPIPNMRPARSSYQNPVSGRAPPIGTAPHDRPPRAARPPAAYAPHASGNSSRRPSDGSRGATGIPRSHSGGGSRGPNGSRRGPSDGTRPDRQRATSRDEWVDPTVYNGYPR